MCPKNEEHSSRSMLMCPVVEGVVVVVVRIIVVSIAGGSLKCSPKMNEETKSFITR